MANGKNLELALRIRADLQAGVKALDDLEQSVADVGAAAKKTDQELDKVTEGANAQAIANERLTASESKLAQAIRQANSEMSARSGLTGSAFLPTATTPTVQPMGAPIGKPKPVVTILPSPTDTKRATDALSAQERAMKAAGLTAGQYQQAMRMLPMQMTDVVTSVASGMPIWMVAIQQGGQIRDQFGGIGNAARAVVSAINPMTAAIAAAVAVAGALVVAYRQGAQEGVAYRESLILTGNAVGLTSDQLAGMATRIDGISGTQRQAAAALAEIAGNSQFAGSQVEAIGTAAVAMENAAGKAVSNTVAEFAKLAKEPAKASAELNQQYNYLTASVYKQIQALEQQGDTAAAAQLAIDTFSQAVIQRAAQVEDNLQGMDKLWKNIKDSAAEAWDAMAGIGREATLDQQIANLDKRIAQAQSRAGRSLGNRFQPTVSTAPLEDERNSKQLQKEQAEGEARQRAALARYNAEAIAADRTRQAAADSFVKNSESQLQSLQKLSDVERARQIMQKQGIEETSQQGQSMLQAAQATDRQRAANEAATDAERKAAQARREAEQATKSAAREAQQLAKQQEHYVAHLERQAATLGKSAAETRAYDLAEKGLTGALLARAQAALAATDAAEKLRQATADGKELAEAQTQLLLGQGRTSEATTRQFEQQYGELRKRLEARGDVQGQSLLSSLLGVQQAKAQLDELNRQINAIFAEQSRREQSIQAQQQAGLISQLGARQQIVDLNAATASQVEALLPKMRELAAATGDPAALERLRDMEAQLGNLRTVTNDLTNALTSGLENGLQNALEGLATGTMSLKEAAISFVQDIARSMAQLASQKIAASATDGLSALFGGGQQSPAAMAAQQIAAIQQVSMAQQAANTAMATSSVVSANTAAAGQATAAATTATAWTPAALTASIGSFGAAAAIGLAALVAALAFRAFKDGGHVTGPGTGTSDSIPARLSNNEFVTRAAVVTQPGALGFLDDFNRRGMAALNDYGVARHATGGLAGVPAPSYPAPALPNGGQPADPSTTLSSTLKNSQTFILADDPNRILDSAYSDQGQERLLIMLSRDPQKFRSVLKMGNT